MLMKDFWGKREKALSVRKMCTLLKLNFGSKIAKVWRVCLLIFFLGVYSGLSGSVQNKIVLFETLLTFFFSCSVCK
jgi:hypothetical protein